MVLRFHKVNNGLRAVNLYLQTEGELLPFFPLLFRFLFYIYTQAHPIIICMHCSLPLNYCLNIIIMHSFSNK